MFRLVIKEHLYHSFFENFGLPLLGIVFLNQDIGWMGWAECDITHLDLIKMSTQESFPLKTLIQHLLFNMFGLY